MYTMVDFFGFETEIRHLSWEIKYSLKNRLAYIAYSSSEH
jgi:hypothetical protein